MCARGAPVSVRSHVDVERRNAAGEQRAQVRAESFFRSAGAVSSRIRETQVRFRVDSSCLSVCACACVRLDIATISRAASPRSMKLSRDVIDVIGDETKPASRDR